MIKHVVCMKFKEPGAKIEAGKVRSKLMALKGKVESLRDIEVGLDVLNSERSYDLVLICTFGDMDGYRAYDKHPLHEEARAYIKGVRELSVTVDYEC